MEFSGCAGASDGAGESARTGWLFYPRVMIGRNCLKSNPKVEDFFRADWFRPDKQEKCWEFTRKKKICGRKVFQKYLICAIFDVADRQHRGALRMLAVFSAGVQSDMQE